MIVLNTNLNRIYTEGTYPIPDLARWSASRKVMWLNEVEEMILYELDNVPETNVRLACGILSGYEKNTEWMPRLIMDMVNTASDTLLPHVDYYVSSVLDLNLGLEPQSMNVSDYNTAVIRFGLVSPELCTTTHTYDNLGGLHAFV